MTSHRGPTHPPVGRPHRPRRRPPSSPPRSRTALLLLAAISAGALATGPAASARTVDVDHDGLGARSEARHGTSPRRADTDRDGLRDGYEVRRSRTNPRRRDSDRDRLRDGYEVKRSHTNPRRADTDGETLGDGFEVRDSRTNPLRADSDGDGLDDARELRVTNTDPRRTDSDGDRLGDLLELLFGFDPRNPASPQIPPLQGPPPPPPPAADTTAPQTTITAGPSGTVSSDSAAISFSSSEPGSTFECRLDAGAWSGCASPKALAGLGAGAHDFEVRARDAANNLDATPAVLSWIVDAGPPPPPPPADCTVDATPATFSAVFDSAGAGAVICLAGGSYGVFRGALKSGTVTIKPQGGATPSMELSFNPASNLVLDGLRITEAYMADSRTKDITIRNGTFDRAQLVFRGGSGALANANILLDRNVHSNFDVCGGCFDGRISIAERTAAPTGITIQNSLFFGGSSDGILNGGNGVRILNNEFRDMTQGDGDVAHTDPIQLYGSKGTLVKGNWFHDVPLGVMCADGCEGETIEDNVFAGGGSPYAVTLLSDNGSVIRHNTFLDHGLCDYGQRCGVLYLGNKSSDPASRNTVVKDNILSRICVCDGTVSGLAQESHNLFTLTAGSGPSDLFGSPLYTGGVNPATLAGFKLVPGSLGKGSASDGADRGARIP